MILAVELQTGKASFVWKKMTLILIVFVNYTTVEVCIRETQSSRA